MSAILTFWHVPWISSASLIVLVMIIDGALLQRASSVVSTDIVRDVSLGIVLAPELPNGFSGTISATGLDTSSEATRVFDEFTDDVPMFTDYTGCGDGSTCVAKVHAPGVAADNCTSRTWQITPEMMYVPP